MDKGRIIIDAEKMSNPYSGLGQFCASLGNSLLNLDVANLCFYLPKKQLNFFGPKATYIKQQALHKLTGIRTTSNDIFHSTHQTTKYFPSNKSTPLLLTVHDLNFLYKYSGKKLNSKLADLQKKVDRAAEITTISAFVLTELEKHIQLNGKKVSVIYNGNSLNESVPELRPVWLNEKPFLFTIGIILPRKNFHTLIPMMENLKEFNLVISGDSSSAYGQSIIDEIKKRGLSNQIIVSGKITESEKLYLYRHCSGFIFPSLAEGFGFPVIEAMSQGKPVFLNHCTSLPEIAGELGNYFNNFEPSHMSEVVMKGMNNFHRNNMESVLRQHAAQFNWNNSAMKYVDIYNRLMKSIR